jgi:hypothetical protein
LREITARQADEDAVRLDRSIEARSAKIASGFWPTVEHIFGTSGKVTHNNIRHDKFQK